MGVSMNNLNKENNKKFNYDSPKIDFVEFDYDDVITASSGCDENRIDCPKQVSIFL